MTGVLLRRGPWGFRDAASPAAVEADLRVDSLDELADALSSHARGGGLGVRFAEALALGCGVPDQRMVRDDAWLAHTSVVSLDRRRTEKVGVRWGVYLVFSGATRQRSHLALATNLHLGARFGEPRAV